MLTTPTIGMSPSHGSGEITKVVNMRIHIWLTNGERVDRRQVPDLQGQGRSVLELNGLWSVYELPLQTHNTQRPEYLPAAAISLANRGQWFDHIA